MAAQRYGGCDGGGLAALRRYGYAHAACVETLLGGVRGGVSYGMARCTARCAAAAADAHRAADTAAHGARPCARPAHARGPGRTAAYGRTARPKPNGNGANDGSVYDYVCAEFYYVAIRLTLLYDTLCVRMA